MKSTCSLVSASAAVVILTCIVLDCCFGCTEEQTRYGCRIQERECLCGIGCDIEYRYESKEDCLAALRGQGRDSCVRSPCKNGGICTQKSEHPGFSCHCAATGFHGPHCETRCPSFNKGHQSGLPINFPTDCIVI